MTTVIVSSNVWFRVYEYYNNVEAQYPNTWNVNDTIGQINKIQWVIGNFGRVCVWNRESIIPYWKRMGWKETWHKGCPWHFAFERKVVEGNDYIYIQNAEHQDDIHEAYANKKIIENNLYNTVIMSTRKQRVKLTESDLRNIVRESARRIISELDWKTYQSAANKTLDRYAQPSGEIDWQRYDRFMNAARDSFDRDYGYSDEDGYINPYVDQNTFPRKIGCDILTPDGRHFDTNAPYFITLQNFYGQNGMHEPGKWCVGSVGWAGACSVSPDFDTPEEAEAYAKENNMRLTPRDKISDRLENKRQDANQELHRFYNNNPEDKYEYQKGKGWVSRQNESLNRIVRESINRVLRRR